MKEIINFDWLLRIRKSDPFFLLVLFQPIYVIWLYKVGRMGEKLLKKGHNILFLISCSSVFISIFLFIFGIENKELLVNTFVYEDFAIQAFGISVGLSFFYSAIYVTILSIKMDELRDEDYHPQIGHNILRCFLLIYWIFGLFALQSKINESYEQLKN